MGLLRWFQALITHKSSEGQTAITLQHAEQDAVDIYNRVDIDRRGGLTVRQIETLADQAMKTRRFPGERPAAQYHQGVIAKIHAIDLEYSVFKKASE